MNPHPVLSSRATLPSRASMRVSPAHFPARSIEELLAAAVDLTLAQYRQALAKLDLEPGERFELERCRERAELFCLLWRHLPLADSVIAALLGMEQQQVINRRMLALRELARLVAHRPRGGK